MKSKFRTMLLALSGMAFVANPAMGAVNLGTGDLAVVFYQYTTGQSGFVTANTYVYELGAASLFRESNSYNVSVSTVNPALASNDIGADLVTAFGANWYNNTGVRWMVVGSVGQSESTVGGDPSSTAYYSRSRSNINTLPPAIAIGESERASLITSLAGFRSGTNGATQVNGANAAGVFINKSNFNSIEEFVPGDSNGPLDYFGTSFDPRQTFGSGVIANTGALGAEEGALNIYRFINTTTGADLVSGRETVASVGNGQYVGTLLINSSGQLTLIPEPSSLLLGLAGGLGLCFRRRRNA